MSLPESAQRSLQRLQELERLSAPDYRKSSSKWRKLLNVRSDNLFFLTMITTLVCLGCLMVLFLHDREEREHLAKELEKRKALQKANLQTREIPLGSFESVSRIAGDDGNVSVLQYEAFLTTRAGAGQAYETELLCMKRQNRLRATVEMVMHKADESELREPNLSSVRSSLVTELNQVVGKNRIQDVQFSNFLHFHMPNTK